MVSTLLNSTFGFLILMGVLVTIHEFGHFYAGKKLGFKVLTFSIGFGKKIWSRVGKDGVEYRIALIPLGGYVGFLDERAHDVKPSEMDQTFNSKPIWKRAVVIAAGPVVNLLFAVILLFGLYLYGMPNYKAKIDTPLPNSIMAQAGFERADEVVSIEGDEVRTIDDLLMKLIEHLGNGTAQVEVLREGDVKTIDIDMGRPFLLNANRDIVQELGLQMYSPKVQSIVSVVMDGSSAQKSGIQLGDYIIGIDDQEILYWNDLVLRLEQLSLSNNLAEVDIVLKVIRQGALLLIPSTLKRNSTGSFKLGVGVETLNPDIALEFENMRVLQKYTILESLNYAFLDAYQNSLLIFKIINRMITGKVHINTMAGPVTIANVAGEKLKEGWVYFIQLMALFSVNLGILNLLPIPVLDGGRLVGLGIEAVAGRNRVPARLSMIVMQLGALFLFIFMAFVILYDITKWF